jgi:hypothetical protein
MGFRGFSLRGKEKVSGEWTLVGVSTSFAVDPMARRWSRHEIARVILPRHAPTCRFGMGFLAMGGDFGLLPPFFVPPITPCRRLRL